MTYEELLAQQTANLGDRVFKEWDYSADGIGNTMQDFYRARPDLFQGVNFDPRRLAQETETGSGPNYWDFGQAGNQALSPYRVQRRGEAGMQDGRRDVVIDSRTGEVVYAGADPYSYDPAKTNLNDALEFGALVAGGYYGVNALNGLTGAAAAGTGVPFELGNMGAVGAGGGGAAGGSLLGGSLPTVGMGGIDAAAGLTGGGSLGSFGAGTAAAGGGMDLSFLNSLGGNSLINLGGNLLNGYFGSKAAGKTSDAQIKALMESNALQKYMYDTSRADWAPYREAGTDALGQIQNLLANPGAIKDQPDYQFGLNEGTNALENSASARGMTYSGQQAKALQRFGNDYAGSKLNESYNRLAGIAGIGQQATGQTQAAGSNYANQAGQGLQDMGNARASNYAQQANQWTRGFGNVLNNYNDQWARKMYGIPFGD
jgi:hypothetical protein